MATMSSFSESSRKIIEAALAGLLQASVMKTNAMTSCEIFMGHLQCGDKEG
jgi:hypothetical protein